MKHKLFLFIATLGMLLPQVGGAATEINGINYKLNSTDGTAEVTENKYNPYTGAIWIPEFAYDYDKDYSVTSIGEFAFEGCINLTSINIPSSVTSIGELAFEGCINLTSINIPSRVKSIGRMAFSECTGLTSIIVKAETPPSVGEYCFYSVDKTIPVYVPSSTAANAYIAADGWNEFEKIGFPYESNGIYYYIFTDGTAEVTSNPDKYTGAIEIPETVSYGDKTYSVTSIGERAFSGCSKLPSIIIPSSVKSIGVYAFENCTGLTSVTIPNGVGSIEFSSFVGCTNLTSITIPSSVKSIGDDAFRYCKGITSITIPSSVKSIGSMAFSECTGLTSIAVEAETPPSVGEYCFYRVDNTIPVYVPNSTYKAADGWKDFANFILPTPYEIGGIYYNLLPGCTAEVTKHPDTYEGAIEIPETVSEGITFNVTGIGKEAFYRCANMTSIVIPGSVTSIGDKAFENCTSLTAVTIPNSVESIGDNAFYYCKRITSITIPSSVKSIGSMAFGQCEGLTSMTVEAETPPSVGYECFFEVKSTIPVYVFSRKAAEAYKAADGWSYFSNIVPPSTYKIRGIYYTLLPDGTAEVTENPDKYTGAIEIPITVSYGGKIYNVTSIGEKAFYECEDLTSVTIPGSVTSIRENAFGYCSLPAIAIPGSVVSIGDYAFLNCNALASITIPSSVESIGERAFSGCSGLTSITVEAETPASVGSGCFFGVDKTIPVYVPSSTAAKVYRAADGWKEFTNIIYQYTLEDKTKYTESKGFKADELIYTRTFSNTEWQALYVPFSMNYEEWENDFDIAKIVNVIQYDDNEDGDFDRTYLVVRKLTTGSTKANYPYLVRAKSADTYSMTLTDKTLVAADNGSVECRSTECIYTFTGTYTGVDDMATPGYYAMAEGSLKQAISSDVPLSPQRWYLNITSTDDDYNAAARAQSIRILLEGEDDTEGIETLSSTPEEDSPVAYDLQGRKFSPFKGERGEGLRGINIVNGKKIIK